MKNDKKIFYNKDLNFEIYNYESFNTSFPVHFHNYYTIGLIKKGDRKLFCNNKNYSINQNDILLFNPETCHGCNKLSFENFNYIALNIPKTTMELPIYEISDKKETVDFCENVIKFSDINFSNIDFSSIFQAIYQNISNNKKSKKELLKILSILFEKNIIKTKNAPKKDKIDEICLYLEKTAKIG